MKNYFYKNLKFLRVSRGWTQLDLAKRLKKDYTTIGKWEKNERTPKLSEVVKIAELFNIGLGDIIAEDLSKEVRK